MICIFESSKNETMTQLTTNLYSNNLQGRFRATYEIHKTSKGYYITGSNGYETYEPFKTRNEVMKQLRETISEDKKDFEFETGAK